MQDRLDQLKKEFQRLELDQMKKGEIEARQKLEAAKKSIEAKRQSFEGELKRAKSVSDQAWDDVSDALRAAWTEMRESVDRARMEFRAEVADQKTTPTE